MNYQKNEPEKQRSNCDYYTDYDSTIEALRFELESKTFPQFVEPMTASSVKQPFDDPDWIFETQTGWLPGNRGH
jgi:hypothetical protein